VRPQENPGGVVYGLITIGALLAAESGLHETYEETVGSAAVAIVAYWLAHSYAELLGHRLASGQQLTWRALLRAFARDWAIVRGATAPLLALLAAWTLGASQEDAVEAALWTCAACLVLFELLAALRARAGVGELVLEVCVGGAMGLAIVALRAILH
jgi:hypothetical protein